MTTIRRTALWLILLLLVLPIAAAPQEDEWHGDPPPGSAPEGRGGAESDPGRGSPSGRPAGYDRLGRPTTMDEVGGGSLLFATEIDGVYLPAPSLETDVHVRVTGMLARTEVRQRFHNPTDAWVEGVYVFPLPERAAVDTLRMVIGDRVIEGRIQEREEAKRTYERAKREGRKAGLVEQERPNLFTTSVANLGPEETVEVVIEYQEELRYRRPMGGVDTGIFSLRVPLVAAPRFVPQGVPGLPGSHRLARNLNGFVGGGLGRAGFDSTADRLRALTTPVRDAGRIRGPIVPPEAIDPAHPLNPVRLTVDLDAGFPVDRLGSSSHGLVVSRRAAGGYRIQAEPGQGLRVAGGAGPDPAAVPADRDFVLEWAPAVGDAPGAALFTEEVDGETYALLMVMPPSGPVETRPLPRETVFVIDTSGSMHGSSIEQARRALRFALERLRPEDSFNVIRFASDTEALFEQSVPADPRALEMARLFVGNLGAGGGTLMLPAIRRALRNAPHPRSVSPAVRQVVFITDGAVGNEAELFRAIREDLGETRLFTVGIGSAPNGHLMRRAAELGRGTFTYIGRPDEVAPKMEELFGKIDSPMLTDVQVVWSDPAAETWPERVPDLYRGEPVVVAARLPTVFSGSGGRVRVRGSRGDVPWVVTRALGGAERRPGVAKLWARRKVEALMSQRVAGAPVDVVRREVVEVALRHHLVSKFTSLVAVDVTPTRPANAVQRSLKLPVSLPAGWSAEHVVGRLPQTGSPARLLLLLGLAGLAAAGLLVVAPGALRFGRERSGRAS